MPCPIVTSEVTLTEHGLGGQSASVAALSVVSVASFTNTYVEQPTFNILSHPK